MRLCTVCAVLRGTLWRCNLLRVLLRGWQCLCTTRRMPTSSTYGTSSMCTRCRYRWRILQRSGRLHTLPCLVCVDVFAAIGQEGWLSNALHPTSKDL